MNDRDWWRHAVVHQVYIRSFCDGNGDGLGDIAGLRSKLEYLAALGVDAIWINPWYPSPQRDAGYDVITYRDVEPRFGTIAEAEAMIAEAHRLGVRVILDIVPNHSSDQHPWFQAALAAGPGSPERERYVFRAGRGEHGELPPNDWPSCFGGPAWTRVVEADGTPGEWYLHLFDSAQPDRNWLHGDTWADYEDALRFWFDRGVDGFRIDVAHSLFKLHGLPDVGDIDYDAGDPRQHPFWDVDEVHDVYRRWRRIADSYEPPRVFVAEAWVPKPSRLARYVRPDELHTTFNFDYLRAPWRADALRDVIDATLREHATVGAPPTWVLSNHDVMRHVSRYARPGQTHSGHQLKHFEGATDIPLGLRRARAALLLTMALPGVAYVYQGEELGLPEVEDLPDHVLQDPAFFRSGGADRGRDGCRVPLPWSGNGAPFGFSPAGAEAEPWLPQPAWFADYAAAAQDGVEGSMLEWYRAVIAARRSLEGLRGEAFEWLDLGADVLAFRRSEHVTCVVNLGDEPLALDLPGDVRLASAPLEGGMLAGDAAVWLQG